MAKQIRGIILEGQSCSGKTSVFSALKRLHLADPDAERNAVFLSEQYSQTLNRDNGALRNLTREENLKVLSDRLSMLESLGGYADALGAGSRRSRGLFYVFERFHLSYALAFGDITSDAYTRLEHRLLDLHALAVLCTISPEKTPERLQNRALYTSERVTRDKAAAYIENQRHSAEFIRYSAVPTLVLNTDGMDWDHYAGTLLERAGNM